MFRSEDGPTALRADLLSGLSFSSRPEDIQIDDHSGSAVAGVSSVWNGSRGFVAVLIRFIDPPHVERYMYSEPLTDESMLVLAQAEALRFAGSMGFRMDDPRFQELDETARAKRLLNWNLIRKVRAPLAPEKPAGALEHDAPAAVGAAIPVEASSNEEAILLEAVEVYADGDSTERFGSPSQAESPVLESVEESVLPPAEAEPLEEVTLESLFEEPVPPTPAPAAPPTELEPPGLAAEEPMMLEPMRAGAWDSEPDEGAVESEPLVIEPLDFPVETVQPAEAAAAAEEIPLESVVLESVAPENDDTPVSLEFVNNVLPATEDAGVASSLMEPNVFEFEERTVSEVDVEPADEDGAQQLHGEPMLEFSDEETIEAEIEGEGGFVAARPLAL